MLIILLVCVAVQACSESKFDYRHKYVGEFDFQIAYSGLDGISSQDTIRRNAPGTVDFGPTKGQLTISCAPADFPVLDLDLDVNKHGALKLGSEPEFSGRFLTKDSLQFSLMINTPTFSSYRMDVLAVRD